MKIQPQQHSMGLGKAIYQDEDHIVWCYDARDRRFSISAWSDRKKKVPPSFWVPSEEIAWNKGNVIDPPRPPKAAASRISSIFKPQDPPPISWQGLEFPYFSLRPGPHANEIVVAKNTTASTCISILDAHFSSALQPGSKLFCFTD